MMFVARSQALLGNVVLQAGACLVSSQSGDWELAQSSAVGGTERKKSRYTFWVKTHTSPRYILQQTQFTTYYINNPCNKTKFGGRWRTPLNRIMPIVVLIICHRPFDDFMGFIPAIDMGYFADEFLTGQMFVGQKIML